MTIIDFHTHAFPDAVAARAIPALEAESNVRAVLNGTVSALLDSMNASGVSISVVTSIATKPTQYPAILKWSSAIASERIIPFPSIHPDDPDAIAHIREIHAAGFRGIKLHPYYQNFYLDEPRMLPLYETIAACGLILLCHTGFDIAYPQIRRCDPAKVAQLTKKFPSLTFVAAHWGGWEDWDNVEKYIIGKSIYIDMSYSTDWIGRERTKKFLKEHPKEYILFGTDSPWGDQKNDILSIKQFSLDRDREAALFSGNAHRLLRS